MTRRSSQYVLENDPSLVPPLVAQFREDLIEMGLCDLTGATRAGIALEEALLNAVYHGNLEVSSELREGGDDGHPITVAHPDSEAAKCFQEIARRIGQERMQKYFDLLDYGNHDIEDALGTDLRAPGFPAELE